MAPPTWPPSAPSGKSTTTASRTGKWRTTWASTEAADHRSGTIEQENFHLRPLSAAPPPHASSASIPVRDRQMRVAERKQSAPQPPRLVVNRLLQPVEQILRRKRPERQPGQRCLRQVNADRL